MNCPVKTTRFSLCPTKNNNKTKTLCSLPRSGGCDNIFRDLKSCNVEEILDHLPLDVLVKLRGRVKTAMKRWY